MVVCRRKLLCWSEPALNTVCADFTPLGFYKEKYIQWLKQEGESLLKLMNLNRTIILKEMNKKLIMVFVKRLHAHLS